MSVRYLLITLILIFTACGGGSSSVNKEVQELDSNRSIQKISKTVTIYVHGYRKVGDNEQATYGARKNGSVIAKMVDITGLPTVDAYDKENFSTLLTDIYYYGDVPPNYYTAKDLEDIEEVTHKYGGGIPRYATILAKYSKYILDETGAEKVNIISVSMGSLVTRWMIEKNLEGLSENKKIERWMSIEGVIRGNYAVSQNGLLSVAESLGLFDNSIDTQHMHYDWIKENLTPNPDVMQSLYYRDILVGQISSTKSGEALDRLLSLNRDSQPNDGYQLVKDTYFATVENYSQIPSHTLFYTDHEEIKEKEGAYAVMATFLESKKRVRVTLIDATLNSISNRNTKVAFESYVFSNQVKEKWGITDAIDERVYNSGMLTRYTYNESGETRTFTQPIFDDFVLSDESELDIRMRGYKIESSTNSLGDIVRNIPLKNGVYELSGEEWSAHLKVEVLE